LKARRYLALVGLIGLLGAATSVVSNAGTESAPTPLTQKNDAAHALEWTGSLGPGAPLASAEDSYYFVAALGNARVARATALIHWETPEDLAVAVLDSDGKEVASADDLPGEDEYVSFDAFNGRRYQIVVMGNTTVQGSYSGFLWVRNVSGRNFKSTGKLAYPIKDVLTTIDVPINIVFVGFDPAEVAAHKQTMLAQLPPQFRPVVRTQSSLGGLTGGLVRRVISSGGDATFEPLHFRYRYNFITTPEAYNRALFAAAKAATTSGDYSLPFDRTFIESYNARAAAERGGNSVAPGSDIDFIDGFTLEDWVAAHPPAGLDFDLKKPANGYTYFVIDSYRPSYAGEYFNLSRYHNFRVMNKLTIDPDSGSQNGFDWARVWGGRYRFLMLDVGAAPNSWEAPVTLANTKIFRLQGDGDSSLFDPPIWHYSEDLEPFYNLLGEDVQWAIWMRFTRGYLYPPHPFLKYILAVNTWHDADAYTPWPSKLETLYKDKLVLNAYQELIPYADFEGFSHYKYLAKGDREQDAIDKGKQQSVSRLPVPFTVSTRPTMQMIDQNRAAYAPLVPGAFTIPVVNVVFQGAWTWSLPAIVGGVAEGQGGEPWGQLQNVNDRTKWPGATSDVTDSQGAAHSPLVPDVRVEGVDNVARFGFTSTTLHEAGHFVGLSHTHDTVGYDWHAGPVDKPDGYFEGIDWMYTTTASPMGYGWSYHKFEVMDKDNTWIGHAIEWLNQAQYDLADAYAALDSKKFKSLPPAVAAAKSKAQGMIDGSLAAMRGGDYLGAAKKAAGAKTMATSVVKTAATSVLGEKIARPTHGAPGKPAGGGLAATGVGSPTWLIVTVFCIAAVLARNARKAYRA
jgi:hypothetical protein